MIVTYRFECDEDGCSENYEKRTMQEGEEIPKKWCRVYKEMQDDMLKRFKEFYYCPEHSPWDK